MPWRESASAEVTPETTYYSAVCVYENVIACERLFAYHKVMRRRRWLVMKTQQRESAFDAYLKHTVLPDQVAIHAA